jgi:hypothetical protein
MTIDLKLVRSEGKWMVELDRWVYTLKGSDEETVTRKSADNFLTDKMDLNAWNRNEVYFILMKSYTVLYCTTFCK